MEIVPRLPEFYTVVISPIPRGISRNELVGTYLGNYGVLKNVRFGDGRGTSGDTMFVDYFDSKAALAAVAGLDGRKDPGTSSLRLNASLALSSAKVIRRLEAEEKVRQESAKKRFRIGPAADDAQSLCPPASEKPSGSFKFIRPRSGPPREFCLISFN